MLSNDDGVPNQIVKQSNVYYCNVSKRLDKPGITILLSTNHISAKQHDNINKQASKCHYTDYVDSVETRVSHQTICLLYAEYEYSLPEQIE